ncbi:transmembrane protein 74-like [Myxocyprinus asiaticus]|uniref:transmembrane protein 74-like n=1 Tax=Myxocyprinus asiaticus TaxID=70543 RepID=UPI0022214DA1|nr:transmembrane protein 74-like [Myxocyprinus asiaticus]XP_051577718.1 transmembrane protein 74-like [Myxocyprinus asiaticus]
MASVELLYIDKRGGRPDPPGLLDWSSSPLHVHKLSRSVEEACHGQCDSAPRTAAPLRGQHGQHRHHQPAEKVRVCCDEELETSFTYVDENVNLRLATPDTSEKSPRHATPALHDSASEIRPEGLQELSLMSDIDLSSESTGKSVDYGFISAVTFLITGISLVIISYAVPRDVRVNPDNVSAREMERLENESARIGAHLDRCVIAGLCFLTLGGVVLSTLLMISMWKGEMYRRKAFAYSKHSTKLYGSINLRTKSSPCRSSPTCSFVEEENGDAIS